MNVHEIRNRLLARADALGIQAPTEEAALDALLEREVDVPAPTAAECRRYYAQHPQQFAVCPLIAVDHILFAVTDGVPLAGLRAQAEQVLRHVVAEPARFVECAGRYSNCPSGAVGGSLGQLSRGDVVPEFWQAIDAAGTTGVIPRLIETRFGLHIVHVARRIEGKPLPFEAVRESIAAFLASRNLQLALREYAHALIHDDARVHID